MAKILTTTNGKGGTGKTSINAFVAKNLAMKGNKVLVIDLDHNCSLSDMFDFCFKDQNSKRLLSGEVVKPYSVESYENGKLDIIPCDTTMNELANIMDKKLSAMLKKEEYANEYDYIILDPPGTWNTQTRNAIFASDAILISSTCSALDFNATENFIRLLSECELGCDVKIIVNRYSKKTGSDEIFQKFKETYGVVGQFDEDDNDGLVIDFPIPDGVSLKKFVANPINYEIQPVVKSKLEKLTELFAGK